MTASVLIYGVNNDANLCANVDIRKTALICFLFGAAQVPRLKEEGGALLGRISWPGSGAAC